MFSISNHIAYDGLMVHGKKPGLVDFPESGWLDVKGRTCEGNWVVEEGAAVEKLLLALRHQYSLTPDDVFLISPSRTALQLNRIAKRLGFRMDRTGTVHKTQGKEATVVILVLGGNIKSGGESLGGGKTQSSERRGKSRRNNAFMSSASVHYGRSNLTFPRCPGHWEGWMCR
jgi:hypothetical protein